MTIKFFLITSRIKIRSKIIKIDKFNLQLCTLRQSLLENSFFNNFLLKQLSNIIPGLLLFKYLKNIFLNKRKFIMKCNHRKKQQNRTL